MKMLVIADDFTGANDTGVQLAKKGARTDVLLHEKPLRSHKADVLVINTESRAATARQAAESVTRAINAQLSADSSALLVYKKIDSTFRGNVGAEIEAAMKASGAKIALVAAAIPAAGRVTLNGLCLVNRIPLVETEFASDPKTPIHSSRIRDIIAEQTALPIHEVFLTQVRSGKLAEVVKQLAQGPECIVVLDAEVESDLSAIADTLITLDQACLLVGAAGFAGALPSELYLKPRERLPVLVVAGSMSEATRKQIMYAQREKSLAIIDVDVEKLLGAENQNETKQIITQAAEVLRQHQHCVLRTCRDEAARQKIDQLCKCYQLSRQQLGDKISSTLGAITLELLALSQIGGLFLTGGDIAIAVARALNAEGYRISAEVSPCIPCGAFVNSEIDDLPVITKAGGFGADNALSDAIYFIEEMYHGK
ncbi:four-carbon acid sugar kinase family protein [Jinshanibacter sp. LJY008]|uniref:Four-carbon acid sugar kinase family protein n=1 Tax=Limnobaculum eriocheiris TaxID=2897391 RepID=A0A9X1MZS5_9GAMM|nr:four-carbon acid sugar kinase family protein [Limnobaculum eriocheiris]MCD1127658.1 four-carbon acid sugar kinase family protein [Limnobaculum eriocheiris]